MGPVPLRHLLGHQVDVGNQPLSALIAAFFWGGGPRGSRGGCKPGAAVGFAGGGGGDKPPVPLSFPPRVWLLGRFPPMARRPPLSRRRAAGFADFSCARHSLAGAQRAHLRPARLFADKLRRRTTHG